MIDGNDRKKQLQFVQKLMVKRKFFNYNILTTQNYKWKKT